MLLSSSGLYPRVLSELDKFEDCFLFGGAIFFYHLGCTAVTARSDHFYTEILKFFNQGKSQAHLTLYHNYSRRLVLYINIVYESYGHLNYIFCCRSRWNCGKAMSIISPPSSLAAASCSLDQEADL